MQDEVETFAAKNNAAWLRDDWLPKAPADISYGVWGELSKKSHVTADELAQAVKKGAGGPSALIWTPAVARTLPAWDLPAYVPFALSASRRFWLILALVILPLFVYDIVIAAASPFHSDSFTSFASVASDLLELSQAVALLGFVGWQFLRTIREPSSYVKDAAQWRRFNAFARTNNNYWVEFLALGLVGIFFFTWFCGLRMPVPHGPLKLMERYAYSYETVVAHREWWRLFTAPLIHGNPGHMLGNLIWLLLIGRWLYGSVARELIPIILCCGMWGGALIGLVDTATKPAVGISAGICAMHAFLVSIWVRTRSLPPYLGPCLLIALIGSVLGDPLTNDPVGAAGHLSGYLIGFCLGVVLVERGARLPIGSGAVTAIAGRICSVVPLILSVLISLDFAGVAMLHP